MQIASIGSVVIWAKHICYNNNKIYLSLADITRPHKYANVRV